MSKEQTPITAEEWLDEEYPYILDGFEYLEIDKQVLEVMEQYAKAKVLEALEREVVKFSKHAFKEAKAAVIWSNDYPLHVAKNYIETEVKPKYKKK